MRDLMRLKQKDIKGYRLDMLKMQGSTCPLCKTHIKEDEAVLDHDHGTGHIRAVLHRSCNMSEGRILSWARRSRAEDPYFFLKNLFDLHRKDHTSNPLHPTHLTETEKEIKALKKRKRKLKTQKGKDRIQSMIEELE